MLSVRHINQTSKNVAGTTFNMIILQDELSINLTVEVSHETQIKGHRIHKNISTPHLEVQCKPENVVHKHPVCLKNGNGGTIGHLKKVKSGCFAKVVFYYLQRSHSETKCTG